MKGVPIIGSFDGLPGNKGSNLLGLQTSLPSYTIHSCLAEQWWQIVSTTLCNLLYILG